MWKQFEHDQKLKKIKNLISKFKFKVSIQNLDSKFKSKIRVHSLSLKLKFNI